LIEFIRICSIHHMSNIEDDTFDQLEEYLRVLIKIGRILDKSFSRVILFFFCDSQFHSISSLLLFK